MVTMAMVASLKMSNPKCTTNRISGVMVSMLASSAVDRGFEPWSGQTKDYKIGICYFTLAPLDTACQMWNWQ
jgi:hypothetical protein